MSGSPGSDRTRRPWAAALAVVTLIAILATVLTLWAVVRNEPRIEPRVASPRPASARGAAASPLPDGLIAFAGATNGVYHIHVIRADGTGDVTLTSGTSDDKSPAWSPGRDRIAFVRTVERRGSEGRRTHIFVMAADGSGVSAATFGDGLEEDPAWSPDGGRLAITVRDAVSGYSSIAVVRVGRRAIRRLSEPPPKCADQEPAWSPDGASIAFSRRCAGGSSGLFVMAADGTGVRLLTPYGRTPDWSPDGTRIAYTGMAAYGAAIFVIDADGTDKLQLTTESSGDPVWSPDGRHIAFTQNALAALKLFVIDVDGSNLRALTNAPTNEVEASW